MYPLRTQIPEILLQLGIFSPVVVEFAAGFLDRLGDDVLEKAALVGVDVPVGAQVVLRFVVLEYIFSSECTDKDIPNEPTNVVDLRFPMYQIRTCQCSRFAISNATDSAGCAYALQRLTYTSRHPPAEVFLALPKPKPIVKGTGK